VIGHTQDNFVAFTPGVSTVVMSLSVRPTLSCQYETDAPHFRPTVHCSVAE